MHFYVLLYLEKAVTKLSPKLAKLGVNKLLKLLYQGFQLQEFDSDLLSNNVFSFEDGFLIQIPMVKIVTHTSL